MLAEAAASPHTDPRWLRQAEEAVARAEAAPEDETLRGQAIDAVVMVCGLYRMSASQERRRREDWRDRP